MFVWREEKSGDERVGIQEVHLEYLQLKRDNEKIPRNVLSSWRVEGGGAEGRVVYSSETAGKEEKEINDMKLLANRNVEEETQQPLCFCFLNKSYWMWGSVPCEDVIQILGCGKTQINHQTGLGYWGEINHLEINQGWIISSLWVVLKYASNPTGILEPYGTLFGTPGNGDIPKGMLWSHSLHSWYSERILRNCRLPVLPFVWRVTRAFFQL